MRRRILAVTALALTLVTACSDDPTHPMQLFDVTVRVVDPGGQPVPGLDLMVVMDSPFYQDGLAAEKAAVAIKLQVPYEAHVTLKIEDAAGVATCTLVDGVLVAGVHQAVWNGRDANDVPCYSGLYWVHMIGHDPAGAAVYDMRYPVYMALIDFEQATLGTTNGAGEIVLRDQRLFPALFGDPDMTATDENGTVIAAFPVTATMRFYLRDAQHDVSGRYKADVTGSGQVVELTWPAVEPATMSAGARPFPPGVAPVVEARKDIVPGVEYRLYRPFPNPFN